MLFWGLWFSHLFASNVWHKSISPHHSSYVKSKMSFPKWWPIICGKQVLTLALQRLVVLTSRSNGQKFHNLPPCWHVYLCFWNWLIIFYSYPFVKLYFEICNMNMMNMNVHYCMWSLTMMGNWRRLYDSYVNYVFYM